MKKGPVFALFVVEYYEQHALKRAYPPLFLALCQEHPFRTFAYVGASGNGVSYSGLGIEITYRQQTCCDKVITISVLPAFAQLQRGSLKYEALNVTKPERGI
jgi:hypothetical protein